MTVFSYMTSKLYLISLFSILISTQTISAQIQNVDSLENVLNRRSSDDKEKVDLMNEIAYSLFAKDAQKAMEYASKSTQLSDRLNYIKGKAVSMWVTGLVYIKSDKDTAIKYFQQGLTLAEAIGEQSVICNCLIALGSIQNELCNIKESDTLYEKAYTIASKMDDKSILLKYLINISLNSTTKGEYIKAIEMLEKSIIIAKELKDNVSLARLFNSLAVNYNNQGNFSVALEYYLKALTIFEKLNSQSDIAKIYINIAGIKTSQKEYDESLKYLHHSLTISEKLKDKFKISVCLANIGHTYMKKNDIRALEYYEKALKNIGDNKKSLTVNILVNMGNIYTQQKEYSKALEYLNEAFSLAETLGIKHSTGDIWTEMAWVYFHQKHYSEALAYSNKALTIANELNLLDLQKEIYRQLSEIYAAMNNYKSAYQNHILYKIYNDSIFNENNVKRLADLESAYKYEKEKQIYEVEARTRELQIKSQQGIIIFLIIAFILLSLLGRMIVRSYKLKKKLLDLELEEANAELERNKKEMTAATLKLVQTAERDVRSIKMLETIEKGTGPGLKDEIKSLIFDYKAQAHNSNWEEFEILFQKVHPSFNENLNAHFPNLTQNERKLCIFLKLNMTNKQISQITFQSEEALKKARQRLRRKLNIDRDTSLVTFIQSI